MTGSNKADIICYNILGNSADSGRNLYVSNANGSNITGVYLNFNGVAWISTSDRRLKKNIVQVDSIL